MRYQKILRLIEYMKPSSIVEVGTWNGMNAIRMCDEALKHQRHVRYWGFDLFDKASFYTDELELNVKPHHDVMDVSNRLREFRDGLPDDRDFDYELFEGFTSNTLWDRTFRDWPDPNGISHAPHLNVDFVFIDGGHSVETIRWDYDALCNGASTILLDDYYIEDDEGQRPDVAKFGCNTLVDSNPESFTVIPSTDPVKGGGYVAMALNVYDGAQATIVEELFADG